MTEKNNMPALELRKVITDPEIIKNIVSNTAHAVPISLMPRFTDPIKGFSSLVEKGIIYVNGNSFNFVQ